MLTVAQRIEALQRQEVLAALGPEAMESLVRRMGERELAAGEWLFLEGDPGDAIFFIAEGEVEILRGSDTDPVVLAVLEAPDLFGEMAVFTDGIRTSSARARGPAKLFFLKEKAIKVLIQNVPEIAFGFFRILTQRVRRMNDYVTALTGRQAVRARLTVIEGPDAGRSVAMVGTRMEIGRSAGSPLEETVRVSLSDRDPGLARHHAEVTCHGGDFFLRDLGTPGGTLLNGEKVVDDAVDLRPGDQIVVGATRIRFEVP